MPSDSLNTVVIDGILPFPRAAYDGAYRAWDGIFDGALSTLGESHGPRRLRRGRLVARCANGLLAKLHLFLVLAATSCFDFALLCSLATAG